MDDINTNWMISIFQVLAWDPVSDTWLEVGAVSSKGAWQAIGVVIMLSIFVSDDVDDDGKMMTSFYDLQVYLYSYQQAVTSLPLALLEEFCSEENINEEK